MTLLSLEVDSRPGDHLRDRDSAATSVAGGQPHLQKRKARTEPGTQKKKNLFLSNK
jgi:hypothetical protein